MIYVLWVVGVLATIAVTAKIVGKADNAGKLD
ncbi:hypothetical protein EDC44_11611 [Cricetibacter osteomyelitidis]|uniref:Uncharacterized protein n=1 Tax=Cricetibacter osteomyelitidis TaxID=1521931 RepID=A0A4R2SVZ7_9PAST|nr:hypothetical protein EDC44_11611 [Cricetibacter osteomyelitidis]